jgi:tetratricopeptide (TPR) repeat protein
VESIVVAGRGDIGTEPFEGLPTAPDEPGDSLVHRAGRKIQQKLAEAAHSLGNQLAGKGAKRRSWRERLREWAGRKTDNANRNDSGARGMLRTTGAWLGNLAARAAAWISRPRKQDVARRGTGSSAPQKPSRAERFRDWAWQRLQKVTAAMEAARNREVHRLLHLFDTDPDEALRHAISLGGSGIASGPPTTRLTPHGTDFSLGRIGGWQPVDPWAIEWQMRQRLLAKYRELANRELRLGRHRRAAYILAELLGDFAAAAAVLAQGHHFREAAILYRDRLKKLIDAARCLAQAGLWSEAVAIYEAEQQFEIVGDLYVRLQQPDLAEQAYRRAVELLTKQQDFHGAAQLLERKLSAHDEALALLDSAWPWSHQAAKCLKSYFELLGRLGRHQSARERIVSLGSAERSVVRSGMLMQILPDIARHYPDKAVSAVAADTTRVLAGRCLPGADVAESQRLVAAVVGLDRHDKLLRRDGHRYNTQRTARAPSRAAPQKSQRTVATRIHSFQLPTDVTWKTAVSTGEAYWAAGITGITPEKFVLLRGDWEGNFQEIDWNASLSVDDRVLLAPDPHGLRTTWIHYPGCSIKHGTKFSIAEHFARSIHVDAVQRGRTLDFAAIAYDDHGVIWQLINLRHQFTLCGFRSDGSLVKSEHVPIPLDTLTHPENRDSVRALLLAHRDTMFIGVGNHLLSAVRDKAIEPTELPSRIIGLAGAWSLTRPRMSITMERGGLVFWGGLDHGHMQPIGTDLDHPHAAFTRGGTLIVVTRDEGLTYDTHDRQVSHRGHFQVGGNDLVAILPTNVINQFALLSAGGKVQLFRTT